MFIYVSRFFPDFLTIFSDFRQIRLFDLVKSQLSHGLSHSLYLEPLLDKRDNINGEGFGSRY